MNIRPLPALTPLVWLATACSHGPPADFAPDPGLVERIVEIRMTTAAFACPGGGIRADYEAVLDDGTVVPFARKYDEDRPPQLHVVFLERRSEEAAPQEDGDWSTDPDPLLSAMHGFRLHAALSARPSLTASATVGPEYSCLRHAFQFSGATGRTGAAGAPGPDVLVRLGIVRSPFYERLLVFGVEVGDAPPFYVLADADDVPPSDWFEVQSVGGSGARGRRGPEGARGAPGQDGCPGRPGGQGGVGGPGGQGGPGGSGGPITVIVPTAQPFLAGLVDGSSPGGPGGEGGEGGAGGPGGAGGSGIVVSGSRCEDGPDGPKGATGQPGTPGVGGAPGNPPRVLTVAESDVFGPRVPQPLLALLDFSRK